MNSDSRHLPAGHGEPQPGRAVSHFRAGIRPLEENAPIEKTRRNLPHWRQAGCMYYVTFRLADSLPQSLLRQWQAERALWLKLNPRPWSEAVMREYSRRFQGPMEKWLDAGHGSCALREPAKREVVAGALRFFDGERYALDAFVVMPNHVHTLVTPKESDTERPACDDGGTHEQHPESKMSANLHGDSAGYAGAQPGRAVSRSLSGILHSWKSFTAHQLVKHHGMAAPIWMDENFNHIVRSDAQRMHFRNYIRENPAKANLREGEWTHGENDTAAEERDTARPGCEDGEQAKETPESRLAGDCGAPSVRHAGAQPGRAVSHSHNAR